MLKIIMVVLDWTLYMMGCLIGMAGIVLQDSQIMLMGALVLLAYLAGKAK